MEKLEMCKKMITAKLVLFCHDILFLCMDNFWNETPALYLIWSGFLYSTFHVHAHNASHIVMPAYRPVSFEYRLFMYVSTLEHTVPITAEYKRSGYYHPQHKHTYFQVPNFITWVGWNAWPEMENSYNPVLREFGQLPTFHHQRV